jgi:hypothetical protein
MSRQTKLNVIKTNKQNVDLNAPEKRLHNPNGKIPLDWLNNTCSEFKIDCKKYS